MAVLRLSFLAFRSEHRDSRVKKIERTHREREKKRDRERERKGGRQRQRGTETVVYRQTDTDRVRGERERKTFSYPNLPYDFYSQTVRTSRSKLSSAKSRLTSAGRKKGAAPRPFTPQHNNLTEVTEYNEMISKSVSILIRVGAY